MASIFKRGGKGCWQVALHTWDGARKTRSTGTTDKRLAEQMAREWERAELRKKKGLDDPREMELADHNRRPIAEHVKEYLAWSCSVGHDPKGIKEKRRHLNRLLSSSDLKKLSDLSIEALSASMALFKGRGLSAAYCNAHRKEAITFLNWCKRTGRIRDHNLNFTPTYDVRKDRRYVRRAMTEEELAKLIAVGQEHGRGLWYLLAVLAGLRRGDLEKLTWNSVDLDAGILTIRDGKARREDGLPLHPQLAAELARAKARTRPKPGERVFPEIPTNRTVQMDLLRAGLARREPVLDADGQPIMVGKRPPRPKTRIVCEDADGRRLDLHCLRVSLGTRLAREGVAPQVCQQLMRHTDYRTTLKHYTTLTLHDARGALERLPDIGVKTAPVKARAAGAA